MTAPAGGAATAPSVDWDQLRDRAREMTGRAYAPYSHVLVGAAALVDDGRIVTGCNVENASYGLSLCAECAVASALAGSGGGRLVALSVVGGDGAYLAPCGRCRQILFEFGGPELLVDTGTAVVTLGDLLPGAFGPADLPTRATPTGDPDDR
ncbi:cytidine deaminase [soil metagenome]